MFFILVNIMRYIFVILMVLMSFAAQAADIFALPQGQISLPVADFTRLNSILKIGLLSGKELHAKSIGHQVGYDEDKNTKVFFNTVRDENKLHRAIFDPADGVYQISLEYPNDGELVKRYRDEEVVSQKYSELSKDLSPEEIDEYSDVCKLLAFKEALPENADFLKLLTKRAQNIAILILDTVQLTSLELEVLNNAQGFYYFTRDRIEAEKIKFVILSDKLKDTQEINHMMSLFPTIKFEFVPAFVKQTVPYSYKDRTSSGETIEKISVQIHVPDFLPKLKEIFSRSFATEKKLLFIHAARL